jgi:hypothetical protein
MQTLNAKDLQKRISDLSQRLEAALSDKFYKSNLKVSPSLRIEGELRFLFRINNIADPDQVPENEIATFAQSKLDEWETQFSTEALCSAVPRI